MVALSFGELMAMVRGVNAVMVSDVAAATGTSMAGMEFVALGFTIVVCVLALGDGGVSLNVTTPFSSTDL